ncbi:MAG: mechanosensitive ion channel family protein, partial [Pseudomonadota bacterium]
FDRASIIIPNSDLMTAAVTNWTYGSRLGRVVVEVGVSYESDPQFVHDTLIEIGRNCSLALATPPPSVIFKDFAASTLNFALRIYIADINNVMRTQTELRMAIWKVFRERDISIDFPQLDVHLSRKPQKAAPTAVSA